jgi:SARP family transcriptional regulator, regulator of embCAB operon
MEFRVLGSVGLVRDGAIHVVRGSRQRTLLALLSIHAGEVVTKMQLFEELWGERVPGGADNALQALVTRFRRTLRDCYGEEFTQGSLVTRPAGYTLQVAPDQVDAHLFDSLAAQARAKLPAEPWAARELLDRALALWHGPALQGVAGGPICHSAVEQLEEARLAAVEDRIRVNIALEGHAAAVSELKMLALRYPWRERFFELLMVCLYRSGRQAEAIQTYYQVRRRLVDEFGMEPSPTLKRCMAAILNQDPALSRDAPVRDAPVRDAPVRDAPVRDAPVRDAPVRDALSRDAVLTRGRQQDVAV